MFFAGQEPKIPHADYVSFLQRKSKGMLSLLKICQVKNHLLKNPPITTKHLLEETVTSFLKNQIRFHRIV